MKRSPMPARKTPLVSKKPLDRGSSTLKRSAMKSAPKRSVGEHGANRSDKIRQAARGERCTLRIIGVCNNDPETTVWAHVNGVRYNKGVGCKAPDILGAFACYACHSVYDGAHMRPAGMSKEDVELAFWQGHGESICRLIEKGVL